MQLSLSVLSLNDTFSEGRNLFFTWHTIMSEFIFFIIHFHIFSTDPSSPLIEDFIFYYTLSQKHAHYSSTILQCQILHFIIHFHKHTHLALTLHKHIMRSPCYLVILYREIWPKVDKSLHGHKCLIPGRVIIWTLSSKSKFTANIGNFSFRTHNLFNSKTNIHIFFRNRSSRHIV